MVKGVYGTGLTQNKEEIHGEGKYTKRDAQREDVYGEDKYREGTYTEWGQIKRDDTWGRDTHGEGTYEKGVGGAAILCLHIGPLVEVMHLSFALCLIYPTSRYSASHLFRVSLILRLICSASHIFRVSRFRPFPNSQVMSRHQATSRNQSCLTRVRKWGSCSREMYIERAPHPEFSIKLLMRHTQFNLFIDEIFAWHSEKRDTHGEETHMEWGHTRRGDIHVDGTHTEKGWIYTERG